MKEKEVTLETIVSLAKRRGFIYAGSDIYGGLSGTWDYGPLGVALKNNIKNLWWRMFVDDRDDMYGIDAAILMHQKVWEASGHITGFNDPMIECTKCKHRFRADYIDGPTCPECGGKLSDPRQFNMMFKTTIGSVSGDDTTIYLRPETAQGMFVNFKNVIDSFHPKLPFGMAQVGRCFRNEISPREFIFRVRELEILEFEYFVHPETWEEAFENWRKEIHRWFAALGFDEKDIKEVEIPDGERAHYSKRTTDFYFNYPFGFREIGGISYRTDFDLSRHMETSGVDLRYHDQEKNEKFIPHVIEPTFGFDRHVLGVIANAYAVEGVGEEERTVLKFPYHLAPFKAAVFPLLKNKPELVAKAREIYGMVKKEIPQIMWDDNGNIGKRYRRQDEIGTPYCVTIDFDTLTDNAVTVRDRDTMKQERIPVADLIAFLQGKK